MNDAPPTSALASNDSGGFVVTLGADTVSVERFRRTPTTLEGDIVLRVPQTRVLHYSATLGADGSIIDYQSSLRPGTALQGAPVQQATVTFAGDSARIATTAGTNSANATIAARPGAIPLPAVAYALLEQGALQHRRTALDSTTVDLVVVGGRTTTPASFARRGADSLTIWFRNAPLVASIDRQGRLTGLDGSRTNEKVIVRRVASVDVGRIAAEFAARDQGGRAIGQLSPRDTVTATVGGANITLDYSRPARRGRAIWGALVPWDQVWRTGANAATSLTTSADITIGGVAVPAGSYTLFSLPSPSGTKLIINGQTGQWGTIYDPSKDHARVDMASETLAAPAELFTIDIVPSGAGAQLQISWDRTRFTAPIAAK